MTAASRTRLLFLNTIPTRTIWCLLPNLAISSSFLAFRRCAEQLRLGLPHCSARAELQGELLFCVTLDLWHNARSAESFARCSTISFRCLRCSDVALFSASQELKDVKDVPASAPLDKRAEVAVLKGARNMVVDCVSLVAFRVALCFALLLILADWPLRSPSSLLPLLLVSATFGFLALRFCNCLLAQLVGIDSRTFARLLKVFLCSALLCAPSCEFLFGAASGRRALARRLRRYALLHTKPDANSAEIESHELR